jgi:hypothetical protein
MSRARSQLYRAARILGDAESLQGGGATGYAKQLVRKRVYRSTNRTFARALRSLHLF